MKLIYKMLSWKQAVPGENGPCYYSSDEFIADVRLVFQNTGTFNGHSHVHIQTAQKLASS